jgi:hypothetical protein
MLRATPVTPCLVNLATWRAPYRSLPSCQVVASISERSAGRHVTVAGHCSGVTCTPLQVMMSPPACTPCSCLGSGRALLCNVWVFPSNRCSRVLLYLFLMGSGTHRSPEALPCWEARVRSHETCGGSRALRAVGALSHSEAGLKPQNVPRPGALPHREVEFRATSYVATSVPSHIWRPDSVVLRDTWKYILHALLLTVV